MQDDNLVRASWTPDTEARMPEDYSLLPSDWPPHCYSWVGRGPQKGRWRRNPHAVKAYLLSLAERDPRLDAIQAQLTELRAERKPARVVEKERYYWGIPVGIALTVLLGPGLVVAGTLTYLGFGPWAVLGGSTLMTALVVGKLSHAFKG